MSYVITHALTSALQVPDLDTKTEALRGFIEEVCRLHDHAFRAVDYIDDDVVMARDAKARRKIMGHPARYAEVSHVGEFGTFETLEDVRHLFNVFLYWGVTRKPNNQDERAFRALMGSRSEAKPGLLFAIRAQQVITVESGPYAGHSLLMRINSTVNAGLVQLNDASGEYRHECSFAINLA